MIGSENKKGLISQQLVNDRQVMAREGQYLLMEGEREQRQLAQRLHDGPMQCLIGISYQLVKYQKCFTPEPNCNLQVKHSEETLPTLGNIRLEVLDVVTQLRQLISGLHSAGLEKVGLATALERYVLRLDCEETLKIKLDLAKDEPDLPEPIAICLFRVAQQVLHNILQHAQAQHAKIILCYLKGEAILKVHDDGIGLQLPIDLNELIRAGRLGLAGMAERTAWARGQLTIHSQPGMGTEIMVCVPFKKTNK